MIKSTGIIVVESNFMFLDCDDDIAGLYRSFCKKKGIDLIRQRHNSHISVIRTEEINKPLSGMYAGAEVEFVYNPEYLQNNRSHYWFRILSPELEEIRRSLGHSNQPYEFVENTVHTHPFHLTIGRIRGTE